MQYHNLQELLQSSRSSLLFYLSLPFTVRNDLQQYGDSIHSAADLHRFAGIAEQQRHLEEIGKWKKG